MVARTSLITPRRLVCLGGIPIDIVVRAQGFPVIGGDLRTTPVVERPGGPFTVLAAAARLGMPTLYAGSYGSGIRGTLVHQSLQAEGIAIEREPSTEADTGFSLVMVDPSGERTCVSAPGVEALQSSDDVEIYRPQPGDALHVTGYDLADPAGPDLVARVESLGPEVLVFFDPGPLAASVPPGFSYDSLRRMLHRADIVSMNRVEAATITGDDDLAVIGRELGSALVIVRDGAGGAWLIEDGELPYHANAPKVELVDATGAGDTHAGVFLASLAEGLKPRAALQVATVAAAISVQRVGPATSPTRDEITALLSQGA